MILLMTASRRGPYGHYARGHVVDVPDELAQEFLSAGAAVPPPNNSAPLPAEDLIEVPGDDDDPPRRRRKR